MWLLKAVHTTARFFGYYYSSQRWPKNSKMMLNKSHGFPLSGEEGWGCTKGCPPPLPHSRGWKWLDQQYLIVCNWKCSSHVKTPNELLAKRIARSMFEGVIVMSGKKGFRGNRWGAEKVFWFQIAPNAARIGRQRQRKEAFRSIGLRECGLSRVADGRNRHDNNDDGVIGIEEMRVFDDDTLFLSWIKPGLYHSSTSCSKIRTQRDAEHQAGAWAYVTSGTLWK